MTPLSIATRLCGGQLVPVVQSNRPYQDLIGRGDHEFSDGVPITWLGKRARPDPTGQWERAYGLDVMEGVFTQSKREGPRHYLLGSSPAVLAALQEQLTQRFPDAQIVGSESPTFRQATVEELTARDQRIGDSGATLVWVGLGTPKQDVEVA